MTAVAHIPGADKAKAVAQRLEPLVTIIDSLRA